MVYKNIIHNLTNLTPIQEQNLELVDNMLNNINSIRPSNFIKNVLVYDGKRFNIQQGGFLNRFILNDIKITLENDLEKHIIFIKDNIQDYFKSYLYKSKKSSYDLANLEVIITSIIKYYQLNTELSSHTYLGGLEFKELIEGLKQSTNRELLNAKV